MKTSKEQREEARKAWANYDGFNAPMFAWCVKLLDDLDAALEVVEAARAFDEAWRDCPSPTAVDRAAKKLSFRIAKLDGGA